MSEELKHTIEQVVDTHDAAWTHDIRFCCPEDRAVYKRFLVRALTETLGSRYSATEEVKVLRGALEALADAVEFSLETPGMIRGRNRLTNACEHALRLKRRK